ncbi:MAG: hypothetical protein ACREGR_01130 [Minisyncoccia bacterium]
MGSHADKMKLFAGKATVDHLREGYILKENADAFIHKIVNDSIMRMDAKHPNGLPKNTRFIGTFDGGSFFTFTMRKGSTYHMAIWSEKEFNKVLADRGKGTDIVFNPELIVEYTLP